jgi:hypothetical protein
MQLVGNGGSHNFAGRNRTSCANWMRRRPNHGAILDDAIQVPMYIFMYC